MSSVVAEKIKFYLIFAVKRDIEFYAIFVKIILLLFIKMLCFWSLGFY